ncbi:hypothetical protein [Parabacteroides goldsteinii]
MLQRTGAKRRIREEISFSWIKPRLSGGRFRSNSEFFPTERTRSPFPSFQGVEATEKSV